MTCNAYLTATKAARPVLRSLVHPTRRLRRELRPCSGSTIDVSRTVPNTLWRELATATSCEALADAVGAPPEQPEHEKANSVPSLLFSERILRLRELPELQELGANPRVKLVGHASCKPGALDELLNVDEVLAAVCGDHAGGQFQLDVARHR